MDLLTLLKQITMKNGLVYFFILVSSNLLAQKSITYEEIKYLKKYTFENLAFDLYTGKDGHSYKKGDTLTIGRPVSGKKFTFLTFAGGSSIYANSSGLNTIIKKIFVVGTKMTGYKINIIGKGICSVCPNRLIDFEEAIETGEIQSKGISRGQAIAKLKEAKDLFDLGMMSKEDFEKLKADLTPLIIKF